ncbi:GGDEF domain-containing protein [Streptomyces chilikensis]|uniref:GGDEF domain-containing protein n=1 Tax=Streptomyces chilikensis TaxID=1194079 RepID=A0ABV3EXQ3_9ACTN
MRRDTCTAHAQRLLRRHGDETVVVLVDQDHFKAVNDRLGHPAGDAMLRATADRLAAWAGPHATVCRLGGDEFAAAVQCKCRTSGAWFASLSWCGCCTPRSSLRTAAPSTSPPPPPTAAAPAAATATTDATEQTR